MNSRATLCRSGTTILVVVALSSSTSCSDAENSPRSETGGSANAQRGGAGGRSSTGGHGATAGNGASAGKGSGADAGASTGGLAGAEGGAPVDGAGQANAGSGNVGGHSPPPDGVCSEPDECDDGLFCNGVEKCAPSVPGGQVKVCVRPPWGPCGANACDEDNDQCDCTNPDRDGDGYLVPGCTTSATPDCDDTDRMRSPGRAEICDVTSEEAARHDEDCRDNTYLSEGLKSDADGDGFFDARCQNYAYYQPYVVAPKTPIVASSGTDCDDSDTPAGKATNPNAPEVCDFKDNNCNGVTDEVFGLAPGQRHKYYVDRDNDGYGDKKIGPLESPCASPPPGYSLLWDDCDDDDPDKSPIDLEICNGKDDDCDGLVDKLPLAGTLLADEPYLPPTQFECQGKPGWKVSRCPVDRLDCDGKYLNACETIGTTLCNCHACGNVCGFSCGSQGCEEIASFAAGDVHTCALLRDPALPATAPGSGVACWGSNQAGQLGNGTTKNSLVPVRVPELSTVTALAAGARHSCAVTPDAIFCWGANEQGQLGVHSDLKQIPYPARIPDDGLGKPLRLAAGPNHTCAIYSVAGLVCWGRGSSGQLGGGDDGEGLYSYAPVPVRRRINGEDLRITDARFVAAGDSHACAAAARGVECWGKNDLGQIGQDRASVALANTAQPVSALAELVIDELAAGGMTTCARVGTAVYCWGSNLFGELASDRELWGPPAKIEQLPPNIKRIAVGRYFGCALSDDGTLRCWGQYGPSAPSASTPHDPVLVPLANVTGIFGGDGGQVCATTEAGLGYCWGRNLFGEIGNGTTSGTPEQVPRRVLPLSGSQSCDPGP